MERLTFSQVLVIVAFLGSTYLAIIDPSFRSAYGQLLATIIGGYYGQKLPQQKD